MELATTTCDFTRYISHQPKILPILKECGFTNVDYDFCHDYFNKIGFYSDNWEEYLKEVKETAEKNGITFVQSHAPMGRPLVETAEMTEATLRAIRMSYELGVKNIVVHSGYRDGLTDKEEVFRLNKEFFMPLLKLAEELDVNILCENFNRMVIPSIYWIDNAPDLKAFIEYVNHPNFHACWDMGHGNMVPMPQHEALKLLGKEVYALHVQDNRGDDDEHLCPYFGTLNLDSVMHGLKEINYRGYFTFEVAQLPNYDRNRKEFPEDTRLFHPSLELRIEGEKFLHAIGEHILRTSRDR